ncbi:MAG: Flp pilus assembly protein CpaB [Alphaproteobacteria bacterium]|nr:Flp pilus assembly protein CpaB [Alphaproteobacteria bacterium]
MMLRITVFVMMSLGLLGFGTVAWISMMPPAQEAADAAPVVAMDTILVAARDLQAGSLVKPDDIGTVQVPHDKFPEGAAIDNSNNRHQLAGAMVRRRVPTGDLLLSRDLLRPGDHGFLAAVLSSGMRAVTIGVDAITGSAGLIWPGDRIDVLLTHQLDDPSRPVGRRIAAETVLSNVRVIAIDQQLVQGAAPGSSEAKPAATVTLEVTGLQSERISVASRLGRLSLVVRAAKSIEEFGADIRADPQVATAVGPARSGITWAGDVSPALTTDTVIKNLPSVVRVYRGNGDGQEYKF